MDVEGELRHLAAALAEVKGVAIFGGSGHFFNACVISLPKSICKASAKRSSISRACT